MKVQDIYIDKYDWHIRIYYATTEYVIKEVLQDLVSLDCDKDTFFKITDLMLSRKDNIGFTYSNTDKRCTIAFIGKTNSADEFQDTFDHEKGHIVMHICSTVGINPFSEDYQYLSGEIGKLLFKEAKTFLCDHCRKYL